MEKVLGETMKKKSKRKSVLKKPSSSQRKKKLEKELDIQWSNCIRERDKKCRKCGGNGSVSAHHAFGRRHMATRWEPLNGIGLCFPCHIHWAHRDPAGFSVWFEEQVGDFTYNYLASKHRQIVKFTEEDLTNMLNEFKVA